MAIQNRKKVRTKRTGQGNTTPKALAVGVGVSLLITLVLTLIETALLDRQVISLEQRGTVAMVIWLASVMPGAIVGAGMSGERKLVMAMITGVGYALVLLLLTGIGNRARFDGVLKGCAWIAVAAVGAGLVAMKPRTSRGIKRHFR